MTPRAFTLFGFLTIVPFLGAAEVPAAASPFLSPNPAATAPAAPAKAGRWELVGILGTREAPAVRINDTTENAAAWLHVGDVFGNLKLVAADVEAGTATIQVGTERTLLRLRQAGVTAGTTPAPTATGAANSTAVASAPAPLPSTGDAEADARRDQAIQEREARMLVSDLLEISVIQRKAYEDKQAALEKTPAASAP